MIDFCFDGGEIIHIVVSSYVAPWLKDIKDNQRCLNKQQRKDGVAYLPFNCYFIVGPKSLC